MRLAASTAVPTAAQRSQHSFALQCSQSRRKGATEFGHNELAFQTRATQRPFGSTSGVPRYYYYYCYPWQKHRDATLSIQYGCSRTMCAVASVTAMAAVVVVQHLSSQLFSAVACVFFSFFSQASNNSVRCGDVGLQ